MGDKEFSRFRWVSPYNNKKIREFSKMESNNEQDVEIDLKEIFVVLLDRIWIIIGAGVILAALAGIFTEVFITPMYSSTTKLYVINRQNDDNNVTYSDLQTGSSLTNDYVIQVTGNKVLSQVIEELNLDTTVSELQDRITATNPDNTRYIVITVEDADPVVAQQIAESVASISSDVVMDVMDIEKVNVAEEANLPTSPSSPNVKKNILLGGVIGIILAAAVIIIVFLMNDTIRTSEDVKKYLGLNTIGQIPVLEGTDEKKRKNKKKKKTDVDDLEDDEDKEAVPDVILPDMDKVTPEYDGFSEDEIPPVVLPYDEDEIPPVVLPYEDEIPSATPPYMDEMREECAVTDGDKISPDAMSDLSEEPVGTDMAGSYGKIEIPDAVFSYGDDVVQPFEKYSDETGDKDKTAASGKEKADKKKKAASGEKKADKEKKAASGEKKKDGKNGKKKKKGNGKKKSDKKKSDKSKKEGGSNE